MKKVNPVMQWFCALIIAFCVANILCFFYQRSPGWIDTANGPSPATWNPNSLVVRGEEGYGIARVDHNGYMNPEGTLQDSYTLMMGSSHTQGKEVFPQQKYSALVNDYFAQAEGELHVYNISNNANYLPTQIKHFHAAIQAFPNAEVVTMEINKVLFTQKEMRNALQQVTYDPQYSSKNLVLNADWKTKIKTFVKEAFPLLTVIKTKLDKIIGQEAVGEDTSGQKNTSDNQKYLELLEEAIKQIRSEYSKTIVILYHPSLQLQEDATVQIQYCPLWSEFQEICTENNIDIIDMGPVFENWYYETAQLPYGFSNTAPGRGHLNRVGHKLIAGELIKYIEAVKE